MPTVRPQARRGAGRCAAALLFLVLVAGCDRSGVGVTYPVRGKMTLDGQPLVAESTTILFKPDAAKGNTSPFEPIGTVDADGYYTLSTKGKIGAPPGWYKVVVTAVAGPAQASKGAKGRPTPGSMLLPKYGVAKTTPFGVEVVEDPAADAYDLALVSK
jgi:hypothetical protein